MMTPPPGCQAAGDWTTAPSALAIAAHPDDIELMMAGTLLLLGRAGYEFHYLNVANGSCGTATLGRDEIVVIRAGEARCAAAMLGATFYEPLVDDYRGGIGTCQVEMH